MKEVMVSSLDPNFKYEVANTPGGANIKSCFACGVCTGGCPVSEIDQEYDPRRIIRMILLGMKERVLSSDLIWLCSMCYTCSFRCPQDVKFTEVMAVLREMAVREGYVDKTFFKTIEAIDNLSQTLRHHMVMAVVDKKSQGLGVDPKELLTKIVEKI